MSEYNGRRSSRLGLQAGEVEKLSGELSPQEMVDWANANIDRVSELEAENERLRMRVAELERSREFLLQATEQQLGD